MSITPQPLDLHKFTAEVIEEIRLSHPDREVVVESSGDGSIECDPDRMAQLLTNLVNNAVRHGARDRPVRVSTRGDSDAITVEVQNWGDPIPEDLIARVFDPMSQGQQHGRGSIGLGLFIARHVVHAHRGTLDVRSDDKHGTTFVARMPRTAPRAGSAAPASARG